MSDTKRSTQSDCDASATLNTSERAIRLTFMRSAAVTAVGVISASILGRSLGVAGYGRYQLISNLAVQIGQICEAGVGTAVVSVPQSGQTRRQQSLRLLRSYLAIIVLPALFLAGGLSILVAGEANRLVVTASCGLALATLLQLLLIGVLRMFGRSGQANTILLLPAVVHLIVVVGLWWFDQLTASNAIISLAIAHVLLATVGTIWTKRLAQQLASEPNQDEVRSGIGDIFALSWRSSLVRISQLLIYRLDLFLLAFFIGEESLGLYVPAVFLVSQLNQIGDAVGFVLYPSVARREMSAVHARDACRIVMLVTLLAATVIAVTCPWILRLIWGSSYDESVVPLAWLLPGYVMLTPARVLSAYLAVTTQFRSPLRASLTGLAVNSVLNLCLIPSYGIQGAAIATTAALLSICCMLSRDFTASTGYRWHEYWVPGLADVRRGFRLLRFS